MFHKIPPAVVARMEALEKLDGTDRLDGTPRMQRLRQVPPQTGRFLALMAASAQPGQVIEIGASAGYSTLWLSLACRHRGDQLVTFETLPEKARLARQTITEAGVGDVVTLVEGDARDHLPAYEDIAFCFLDAEKEVYEDCYRLVIPSLVAGGLLLADNFTSHREMLAPFTETVMKDVRVDALVVPVGKGVLLCRKI